MTYKPIVRLGYCFRTVIGRVTVLHRPPSAAGRLTVLAKISNEIENNATLNHKHGIVYTRWEL
jgi:hypothetical protein